MLPPPPPNIDDKPLPEVVLEPPVLLALAEAMTLWCSWGPIMFELSFGLKILCASNSEFRWSDIFCAMLELGFSWLPSMCGAVTPFWNNLISLVSLGECGLARAEGALFLVLDFPRPLDMGTALWLSELGLLGGESLSCDWVMLENAPCCGGVEFWDLLERFAELEEMEVLFNWLMIPLAPELLFFPRPPFSDLSTEWDLLEAASWLDGETSSSMSTSVVTASCFS
jgi:hypothetical protein